MVSHGIAPNARKRCPYRPVQKSMADSFVFALPGLDPPSSMIPVDITDRGRFGGFGSAFGRGRFGSSTGRL